jgi:hypothetical protein
MPPSRERLGLSEGGRSVSGAAPVLFEQLGRAEVDLVRLIGRVADCRYSYAALLLERAGIW